MHPLPALLLLICLGTTSPPRINAVQGLTLDEARAATAPVELQSMRTNQ